MEQKIKTIIIVILVAVIALGIIAFIYFKYEKPAQEQAEITYNLNVRLMVGDKQVSEPFVIIMNGLVYKDLISSIDTYTAVNLPVNSTYSIYTESYNYYNTREDFDSYGIDKDLRKDIELQPYGNITINMTNILADKEVFVNIQSNGTIKNPILCFRWSKNIIGVSLYNYTIISKPLRLENKVDKCFGIASQIVDEKKVIDLTFKWFGNIDESDYIKAYLIDADVHYYGGLMAEDSKKNDIGIPDIYFEIH